MRKTIVFDFDKTLTYKDSLKELFRQEMTGIKYPFRIVYLLLAALSKIGFVSVRREKEIMIRLLFGSDRSLFEKKCHNLSKIIKLSPIFKYVGKYLSVGDRVIILSASSIYLLEDIFKGENVEIIGSTFYCENGKIKKIIQHPFGIEKYNLLVTKRITEVDEMFYDSHNDECLIPLCKKWNKVKDGVIIETSER
jgi:hypothetical protein